MRKTLGLVGVTLLLVSTAPRAAAQEPPPPPKVLQIIREDVKPGKAAAHEKIEAGWPRAFAKANWPTHYLAMTAMTGPSEAWFVVGFDSFAAWEKDTKATESDKALTAELDRLSEKDGEVISGARTLVGLFREDLSRRPNVDMSKVRYFRVATYRVRPGHELDLEANAKIVRDAYDKIQAPFAWGIYQVNAGMPGPTYMVWVPMRSLAESDAAMAASRALMDAEGEEGQKTLRKAAADAYVYVETNLFAVNPKMSYPPKEWVDKDPAFWAPKPERAAPPAKKEAKPTEKK